MKTNEKTITVQVPKSRDPFVNTDLIFAGTEPKTGLNRFWTTSYNANEGCIGVLTDEWGHAHIERFGPPHSGFYSAVYDEQADRIWLCGSLNRIGQYEVSEKKLTVHQTGASSALVFRGMAYDKKTGRIFVTASNPPKTEAVIFDTNEGKTLKYMTDACKHKYIRNSFLNKDGTFTIMLGLPGVGFYRWDPKTSDFTLIREYTDKQLVKSAGSGIIQNDKYETYIPGFGWYDGSTDTFIDGPIPSEQAVWTRYDAACNQVFGAIDEAAGCTIVRWDLQTNEVEHIYTLPFCSSGLVNFPDSDTAVACNQYGYFFRIDLRESYLQTCQRLETDAHGKTDCIRRVDKNTILGTPFITQRFWLLDLKTNRGTDCGRAAAAGGQVNLTWNIDGKIYMASYTAGELSCFDPTLPTFYPENPCVVVKPPYPAMRPIGGADDGETIYYTSNNKYGLQGCMLVSYNTKTHRSNYKKDVFGEQQVRSLFYDPDQKILVGGTTPEGDCGSFIPEKYECYFCLIDPSSMDVVKSIRAAEGTRYARVLGLVGSQRALVMHADKKLNVWNYKENTFESLFSKSLIGRNLQQLTPTSKPGIFVLLIDHNLEIWDLNRQEPLHVIAHEVENARVIADHNDIILHRNNTITLLDNALSAYVGRTV